jgi:hypothetical protein
MLPQFEPVFLAIYGIVGAKKRVFWGTKLKFKKNGILYSKNIAVSYWHLAVG